MGIKEQLNEEGRFVHKFEEGELHIVKLPKRKSKMNKKELNTKAIQVINAVVRDYQKEDEDNCSLHRVSDYVENERQPEYKCIALIYSYEYYKQVIQNIVFKTIELSETKEEIKDLLEVLFQHNVRTIYVEGTSHMSQEHIYWTDLKQSS